MEIDQRITARRRDAKLGSSPDGGLCGWLGSTVQTRSSGERIPLLKKKLRPDRTPSGLRSERAFPNLAALPRMNSLRRAGRGYAVLLRSTRVLGVGWLAVGWRQREWSLFPLGAVGVRFPILSILTCTHHRRFDTTHPLFLVTCFGPCLCRDETHRKGGSWPGSIHYLGS
jgi:hypothetical protein